MVAIAMGLLWGGYTAGLYGYILIRGYNVGFRQIISPTHWYSGPWPPPLITDPNVLIPTGTGTPPSAGTGGSAAGAGGGGPAKPPNVGKLLPKIGPPPRPGVQ